MYSELRLLGVAYLDECSVASSAQAFVLDHGQGDAPVGLAAPAAAAARERGHTCCAATVVIPVFAIRPVSLRSAPGVLESLPRSAAQGLHLLIR